MDSQHQAHSIRTASNSQRAIYALQLIALTLVYFAAGKIGLAFAGLNPSVSPVWAPTGIAIAAVLVLGYRAWPAILLGAFLANFTTAGTLITSAAIAGGNTLEALLGGYLVNRFAGGRTAFDTPQGIFRFVLLAGFIAPIVSAVIGVTSLTLAGLVQRGNYGALWLTWWLGDVLGALVITPILAIPRRPEEQKWDRGKIAEAVILLGCLLAVAMVVFGGRVFDGTTYPLEYLAIPIILWVAIRFNQREAALSTLILSAVAIDGTLNGVGPFVQASQDVSLLLQQAFVGTASIMGITVGSVILQRKRTEAAGEAARKMAEEAVQLKIRFLGMISHELRTPLTAIKGFASTLLATDVTWTEADQRDFIGLIDQEADRLTEMIAQLLDLSRLQAGVLSINPQPVDPLFILREAQRQIDMIRGEREIVYIAEPDLAAVVADTQRIIQVLCNLVENAVKYSPDDTPITIHLCHEDQVRFSVADRGIGIAREDRERIFEPFQQVEGVNRVRGVGLGLAICKGLIEAHGGRIWVDNGLRTGTQISFTLPSA